MRKRDKRHRIDLGGTAAFRIGGPSRRSDVYYWIMEMSWPVFAGLVASAFLLLNLLFGALYAALPGAVANAAPGSLIDGFFFSVDTLATVGYGQMYPSGHAAHAVAAFEILVGLFFSATVTGLIFARFARPRVALLFSRVAVLGWYNGQRALMLRVAPMRSRPLANATANLSWLKNEVSQEGRTFRALVELPLLRNRNPLLALAWTLVHIPQSDEDGIVQALLGDEPFMLTASVGATDTLLDNPTQAAMRYNREDIRIDHHFVDIISDVDGAMHVDVRKLHDTQSY